MEYGNLFLPSFLEGEESTRSFNKGMRKTESRSFVREPGSQAAFAQCRAGGGGEEISALAGEEGCWKLSV